MKILYFAWLREKSGQAEQWCDLPQNVNTVSALIRWLCASDKRCALAFENIDLVRVAIDQEFASLDDSIADAREVAFFPPMTGG